MLVLLDTPNISSASTLGWPLENAMSYHYDHHEQQLLQQHVDFDHHGDQYNLLFNKMEGLSSPESLFNEFPQDPSSTLSNGGMSIGGGYGNMITPTVKKLNHNASERDRRKKINDLYSSLRSLLPSSDQMKKSSIPTTVSRVVKYIPELQKQVEKLIQRKENLTSNEVQLKSDHGRHEKTAKDDIGVHKSLSNVSTSIIGEREIMVQMTTTKVQKNSSKHVLLSEVLSNLQDDGFHVINASFSETSCDPKRVFYNIHLQVEGERRIYETLLTEKLLAFLH